MHRGPRGHTRGHRSAQGAHRGPEGPAAQRPKGHTEAQGAHRGPVGTQRPKGHTEAQRAQGPNGGTQRPQGHRGSRGTEALGAHRGSRGIEAQGHRGPGAQRPNGHTKPKGHTRGLWALWAVVSCGLRVLGGLCVPCGVRQSTGLQAPRTKFQVRVLIIKKIPKASRHPCLQETIFKAMAPIRKLFNKPRGPQASTHQVPS